MNTLLQIIISMRPRQWFKNLFLFAGLVFSLHLLHLDYFFRTLIAFFLFSLLTGSVYIINDLVDFEKDKKHPKKSNRPIASLKLAKSTAVFAVIILLPITISAGFFLNTKYGIIQIVYFILQLFYSFYGKNIVILDVMLISFGFVIRAVAGSFVIDIGISHWLLICTLLLSIFLALCKRRHELVYTDIKSNAETRAVLSEYRVDMIDQMISIATASTLMAYILYTISQDVVMKFRTTNLLFTIPMVLFGIFRYLYIVYVLKDGESPERVVLSDTAMIINIVLWFVAVVMILYFKDSFSFLI